MHLKLHCKNTQKNINESYCLLHFLCEHHLLASHVDLHATETVQIAFANFIAIAMSIVESVCDPWSMESSTHTNKLNHSCAEGVIFDNKSLSN
jgi:hypothetical protein